MKKSLFEYNLTAAPESTLTRGNFWKIVKADATGALSGSKWGWWGALIGAAVFSTIEALDKYVSTQDESYSVIPWEIGLTDGSVEILIGKMHNEVINNIFDKYPGIEDMTIEQVMDVVYDEVCLVSGEDGLEVINSDEFREEIDRIKAVVNEGKHLSDELSALYPELAAEIEIIDMYCETIQGISAQDDINSYTDGFIEIINESPVGQSKKTELVSGVVTGLNSNNLWAH